MKKNFCYLSLLLGLVCGITMFATCGSDDNNGGGTSGGGETGFVPGKFMGPKRVFGDNMLSSFGTDSRRFVLTYNSENLVTKVERELLYNGQVESTKEYDVTYSDKQVTVTRKRRSSEILLQYTFTIGNNGFAESYTCKDIGNGIIREVVNFGYDSDGHVTKITFKEPEDKPWGGTFTWQDGNITEKQGDDGDKINYTYTDVSNVAGHFFTASIRGVDDLYIVEFYYMGLLGKSTAKLVKSYNMVRGTSPSPTTTGENSWTLDDTGRPISCVSTENYADYSKTYHYFWNYR